MNLEKYRKYADIARGRARADLVLKNGKVVNVFTKEIVKGDVAIQDGRIVGVGSYEGKTEIDVQGQYICPGFIDSHLHLESTLVTPGELVGQAALRGTTTFIVDPHESANVAGMAGVDYILEQTEEVPANVYVMLPSCVPATGIDDNGACITAEDMAPYVSHPRILGLGEVMDYLSVVEGSAQMHEKLALFDRKVKDGHAPFLCDGDLQAYAMAGIATDHECTDFEYARKERRAGMTVLIREGSAAKNLEAIVSGIVETGMSTEGFCFCTDDKHIEDIQREGHISWNVKKAISLGIDPVSAICMATIQPARCYGLSELGAIAPGYQADLLLVSDLEQMEITEVYHKGEKIDRESQTAARPCEDALKNTVHVKDFSKEKLILCHQGTLPVIQMEDGQITTTEGLWQGEGSGVFVPEGDYAKIAVVERHKETGMVGVGVVKGYGIKGGAIASSVSHDSHNIIVIGDNDRDMALAVEELMRTQGGYTLVEEGQVFDTLALPVMGLISDAGFDAVQEKLSRMIPKAHAMGVSEGMDPFITLSFMALPVIPAIRITPRGVYQVEKQVFVSGSAERKA